MVDVAELSDAASAIAAAASDVSPHSRASYERRWRMWEAFASHHGIPSLPADEGHVAAFVVGRHTAGVSSGAISSNLSAIRWFHERTSGTSGAVTEKAKVVLRALSYETPRAPISPAPILSVGALIAMADALPVRGRQFAAKVVRTVVPGVQPRQLVLAGASDVTWGPDFAWADLRLPAVAVKRTRPALPVVTLRFYADPSWVACPVRALRLLTATGDGPIFKLADLHQEGLAMFNPTDAADGVDARIQVRNTAVICVGYEGALRNEDLARARVEHLEPVMDGYRLRIPDAKTDEPDQAVVLARRDDVLCPIRAIDRWLAVRGDHDGALFTHVHHLAPGRVADGEHLPSGSISGIVGEIAVRVGLPKEVSGFSLRRSWATHRYLADPNDLPAVSMQLRHASINMTVRYIEDLRLTTLDPASVLSLEVVVAGAGGISERRQNLGFSDETLDELLRRADAHHTKPTVAASTARGYESAWAVWERFADANGLTAIPAEGGGLGLFIAERADKGIRADYLDKQLGVIARRHKDAGLDEPELFTIAEEVLDAYARLSRAGRRKAPILSVPSLLAMVEVALADGSPTGIRDLVTLTAGYSGAMRVDDLRRVLLDDIEDKPWGLVLPLRASKDNARGQRAETVLLLQRDDVLDPVGPIRKFMDAAGTTTGPLVPSVIGSTARPASYGAITDRLKRLAATASLSVVPTGHSLRRSWATHAYDSGVDLVTIQRHLRHSQQTITKGYIASLTPWTTNAAVAMAKTLLPSVEFQDRSLRR